MEILGFRQEKKRNRKLISNVPGGVALGICPVIEIRRGGELKFGWSLGGGSFMRAGLPAKGGCAQGGVLAGGHGPPSPHFESGDQDWEAKEMQIVRRLYSSSPFLGGGGRGNRHDSKIGNEKVKKIKSVFKKSGSCCCFCYSKNII